MSKIFVSIGECMVEMRNNGSGNYALGYAGDCFNTAYYFNRSIGSGWTTQFYTAVGTDSISAKMIDFMAKSGIDTRHVMKVKGHSVGLYLIELDLGERSFHYWRGQSAARRMPTDGSLADVLIAADVIYLSGITVAILDQLSRARLLSALDESKRLGKLIAFDPNIRRALWENVSTMRYWTVEVAKRASIVLPSFDDDAAAFGDAHPADTVERYRGYGATNVVVKNSGKPIVVNSNGVSKIVQVPGVDKIVDTTSAGDSFNGAYLARFVEGAPVVEAVESASNLAANVIGQFGAIVQLDTKEVDKFKDRT